MMSMASQSNGGIKRELNRPFEPKVSGDTSATPEAAAASATNINTMPTDGLSPQQAPGAHQFGTVTNATVINPPQKTPGVQLVGKPMNASAIYPPQQDPLLQVPRGQMLGTNTNSTVINTLQQAPGAQQVGTNANSASINPHQQSSGEHLLGSSLNNNGTAINLTTSQLQNTSVTQPIFPLATATKAALAPGAPIIIPPTTQTAVPMAHAAPQNASNLVGPPLTPMNKKIPTGLANPATVTGVPRSGNGGGGQLLQFPWKLHEMLHLAEKNGKTDIISWLPGGNGFKVHNKEKFCAEIMPGYFASQKYKTFQRSLNLWGFESVAKGPDRGACYHQYFVKGHPELCHNMTRVKIKGQSNPRTPAAAAAAAAAAAKSAAMTAAMTAGHQPVQQGQQAQGLIIPQQQVQQQQPLNMFTMNHFLPGAHMGLPQLGMQAAAGNQGVANANLMAAAAANPYALAMNNFAAMNFLQQINPALAAASLQNPAMNAVLAAQVMAAAAANNQQARGAVAQQQQLAPGAQPGTVASMPTPIGVFPQNQHHQQPQQQVQQQVQRQQQNVQRQQQMGFSRAAPTPATHVLANTEAVAPGQASDPAVQAQASTAPSTSANAHHVNFVSQNPGMVPQLQQQHTIFTPTESKSNGHTNVAQNVAPATLTTTTIPNLAPQSIPAPASVNVPAQEVNTEGAVAV